MASKENQNQEATTVENLNTHLTSAGSYIAENKKIIYWAVCAIIIVGLATIGLIYFYFNPRQEKAQEAFTTVLQTAAGNDSIAAVEYMKVAKKYSGTTAGKLAYLGAGEAYYNLKKYKEAADALSNFSSGDEILAANALILEGDCYVNLNKYDQALALYEKAINKADENPEIVPRVLLKEANIYDAQKKYQKALECYEQIEQNYPDLMLGNSMSIDAYIEREKARLGQIK